MLKIVYDVEYNIYGFISVKHVNARSLNNLSNWCLDYLYPAECLCCLNAELPMRGKDSGLIDVSSTEERASLSPLVAHDS